MDLLQQVQLLVIDTVVGAQNRKHAFPRRSIDLETYDQIAEHDLYTHIPKYWWVSSTIQSLAPSAHKFQGYRKCYVRITFEGIRQ